MKQGSSFGGFANGTVTTGTENLRGKSGLGGNNMFWAGKILFEVPIGHLGRERHRNLSFSVNLRRAFSTPHTLN